MATANMSRREDLAGKTVKQGGYTVTYDRNGYATSAVNDGGKSATSTVKTTNANNSPAHQAMYEAAKSGDWDKAGSLSNGLISTTKDASGGYDMSKAKQYLSELQGEFSYNANDYYTKKIADSKSSGSTSGGSLSGSSVASSSLSGSPGSGYSSFDEFLDSMGYDSYEEQTRKYIQAAIDNAVKGYESQIDSVNADTAELARQAYVAKVLGEKNLDQQLAASGLAGGLADSQRIGIQANYENDLATLEQQRADTVKELELAIENAKLTGDMQAAQELASYLQQVQGQWSTYVQNQQQLANQNYWNQLSADTDAANTARTWALTLLQNGSMPDETTLTAAGISQTEAQSLLQQVLASQKQTSYVEPVAEPTVEDNLIAAIAALSQNSTMPMSENEVRSLWNSGYDFSGYASAIPALAQYLGTDTGVEAKEYQNLLNNLNLAMSEETKANAGRIVNKLYNEYWDQLNDTQRQEVDNLIRSYGFAE